MKSCPVAALARKYDELSTLSFSGVPQDCYDEIMKTLDGIRAVASYLPARSPKGRAFHRWCIEVNVDLLGNGVCGPRKEQLQPNLADAVLRMAALLPA
jgi:hypothetical protein